MALRKREIAKQVAEESEVPFQTALKMLEVTLNAIREELSQGGRVVFRNFGTFDVYGISARVGRNPKQPEAVVTIPPRKLVRFHPGKELKKDVNSQ